MHNKSSARYLRQNLLPGWGEAGQEKIRAGSVLVIGVGGLGSPAAFYLAAAGIGTLGLLDSDQVELSNLQRQILHATLDIGKAKVKSAQEKLHALNPEVTIRIHPLRLEGENIRKIIEPYQFIISAVDNFPDKYLISDACVAGRKPFCHAGISGYEGQIFTYLPQPDSGCLRCLFSKTPPAMDKINSPVPVFGPAPGVMGTLQATEALKYFLGAGALLVNRLLLHDARAMTFREIHFKRSSKCELHAPV